jgi:predicted nucleic acid-binding protein
VGVVVFDSDVLIGFLHRGDAHHAAAVELMREALEPGTQRRICAVNLSEVLIGPIRAGTHQQVEAMLVRYSIETTVVDMALAQRAAAVRARTNLKLPDAYALATALHAARRDPAEVRLATFDQDVRRWYAELSQVSA